MTENEPRTVIDRGATASRDGAAEDASLHTLTGLGPLPAASAESHGLAAPLPLDSAPKSVDLMDEDDDIDEPTRVYMDPLARLVGASDEGEAPGSARALQPQVDASRSGEAALPRAGDVPLPSATAQQLPFASGRSDSLAHARTLDSLVDDVASQRQPRGHSYPPAALDSAPSPALDAQVVALPSANPAEAEPPHSGPRIVAEQPRELGVDYTAPDALPAAAFTKPSRVLEPTLPRATSASDAPWGRSDRPPPPARHPLRSKLLTALLAFAASVALTVTVLLFFWPRNGALLVTVGGPAGAAVQSARVFVDGKPACEHIPCWVGSLPTGAHAVRVQAPGYLLSPTQVAVVHAGDSAALHVTLKRANTARLEVRGDFKDVHVVLDGQDRGVAPLTLNNLTPGEHTLRLAGNSGYAPYEQRIALESDKLTTVEPTLTMLKGTLTLRRAAGLDGARAVDARIEVEGPDGRQRIRSLPATVELRPGAKYHVWASREGYQDFDADVTFDPQHQEQELELLMRPSPSRGAQPAPANIHLEEEPAAGAAESPLSLSSTPPSSVIVDGRPQGATPRQISVAPGVHNVVFVHPTLGRKSVTVKVLPGKPASSNVQF